MRSTLNYPVSLSLCAAVLALAASAFAQEDPAPVYPRDRAWHTTVFSAEPVPAHPEKASALGAVLPPGELLDDYPSAFGSFSWQSFEITAGPASNFQKRTWRLLLHKGPPVPGSSYTNALFFDHGVEVWWQNRKGWLVEYLGKNVQGVKAHKVDGKPVAVSFRDSKGRLFTYDPWTMNRILIPESETGDPSPLPKPDARRESRK